MTASACTLTVTASACASSCHVRWVLALASQETFATPRVAGRGAGGSRHPEIPNTQHTHTAHIRTKHTLDTVRGKHAWKSRRNVLQRIYNIKFAHLSCYYCNSLFHSFVYFIIFHPFVHFVSFNPLHPFHHISSLHHFILFSISSHFITFHPVNFPPFHFITFWNFITFHPDEITNFPLRAARMARRPCRRGWRRRAPR